ncbi:choline dehydrogenase, mitochondrial-like [Ptychodera flava]|uniref:choline dehydrogenase, mitochondrial-like n=1 Tax=Ptychodera flava TaxID=63121 RepID=UPI00396A857D
MLCKFMMAMYSHGRLVLKGLGVWLKPSLFKCVTPLSGRTTTCRAYRISTPKQAVIASKRGGLIDKPSLIIFDKDGTLVCIHSMWSLWVREMAAKLEAKTGYTLAEKVFELLDYDKVEEKVRPGLLAESTMPIIKRRLQKLLEEAGKSHGEAKDIVDQVWEECYAPEGLISHGDLPHLMQSLREQGIKIAVCTADSRAGTNKSLKGLGIAKYVDQVVCGDDPGSIPKPSSLSAKTVCKKLGVPPSETMVVGDTLADTGMGLSAKVGCVVGVLSGVCSKEELLQEADFIVDDVHDIPSLFRTQTGFSKPGSAGDFSDRKSFARLYSTRARSSPLPASSSSYTHVIVGAGSAGCVLANRLSESEDNSVLVLEAGPKDNPWNWKIHMPAALMYNLCNDKYNWFYTTEPQEYMDNREMYWPRGRVWGGSSALNAMCYVRGHPYDYDRWESEGAQGWSYADCLPYFKKAQTHELGEDDYRGGDGPLYVSRGKADNPLFKAFIDAGVGAGYPTTDDMNGYQQEGFGFMDMTIHKGVRCSTARAYLRPVLQRPNLTAHSKTMVNRILYEGHKAVGVEYVQSGKVHKVRATKEVIISGGAINSPQTLMLSGIGNADDLRKLGIPVVCHLPGVGQNLQDHLEVYVQQACTQPITLYKAQWKFPLNMVQIGLEWFLFQTGKAASAHLEAGAFIRRHMDVRHPDVQFHFLPSVVNDHGRKPGNCHAYQVHVGPMRPTSVGYLKLRSANPADHPIIQPNYLSTESDREEMRDCIKIAREVLAQKAFDQFRGPEIQPGPHIQSDNGIDAFIRQKADSAYHPSCTCKMGREDDPMAVVDNHTRVFGIQNLRVVDASIMPSIASGNLNAPTIMIAEKAADIILGKTPLPQSQAPVWKPAEATTPREFAKVAQ